MLPRFFIVFLLAGAGVVVVSFLWPKFTTQVRPAPLSLVRSYVGGTVLGTQIASILGVEDEYMVEPVSVGSMTAGVTQNITQSLTSSVQRLVFERAALYFFNYYRNLSPGEQIYIKDSICQNPQILGTPGDEESEKDMSLEENMEVEQLEQK